MNRTMRYPTVRRYRPASRRARLIALDRKLTPNELYMAAADTAAFFSNIRSGWSKSPCQSPERNVHGGSIVPTDVRPSSFVIRSLSRKSALFLSAGIGKTDGTAAGVARFAHNWAPAVATLRLAGPP